MSDIFNLLTGRKNNLLKEFSGYLVHQEIIDDLEKLITQAKKDINADLSITSSFRDFYRQQSIWNLKASGKRKVMNDQEEVIDPAKHSKEKFLKFILRFSAIPGLSRHHWGTDIDIFDSSKMEKSQLKLIASEYEADGPCSELSQWLNENIQSQSSFGFFKPYAIDLGGIAVEQWHISYSPLSSFFYEQYSIDTFHRNLKESEFVFKDIIEKDIDFYFNNYFKLIKQP